MTLRLEDFKDSMSRISNRPWRRPARKQVYAPCAKRVPIDCFQLIWVNFERRADSPNY